MEWNERMEGKLCSAHLSMRKQHTEATAPESKAMRITNINQRSYSLRASLTILLILGQCMSDILGNKWCSTWHSNRQRTHENEHGFCGKICCGFSRCI